MYLGLCTSMIWLDVLELAESYLESKGLLYRVNFIVSSFFSPVKSLLFFLP